ncbi:MAG: DMT family transporter [Rhodovarius sp.]|nr:DMT family transporter [Rhodovarius sp.]MCX7932880.1 DMT family transporter [Rhodovarius sp.]MDW8315537.1 DMT family transporter [Rhodovarius sp.]
MQGPLFLMAALMLFGLVDANSKGLAQQFSAAQALLIRHVALLLLLAAARALWHGAGGTLYSRHPWLHAARAFSMLGSGMCFFVAFRHLPLADGYLVYFTAPFLTLLLARLFLREEVPARAWLWVGVGFSGVLAALWPQLGEGEGASLTGFAAAALGTLFYAITITINRGLRMETGIARLILWPGVVGILASAPFAGWHWVAPDALQWLRLIANGVMAGAAAVLMALAFRHAPAARLAPFEFIALPWAVTLDLLLFGRPPEPAVIAGGVVVVLACVMSERAVRRAGGRG